MMKMVCFCLCVFYLEFNVFGVTQKSAQPYFQYKMINFRNAVNLSILPLVYPHSACFLK